MGNNIVSVNEHNYIEFADNLIVELKEILHYKLGLHAPITINNNTYYIQCRDVEDRINLLSIFSSANLYVQNNDPNHLCKLRDANNINHEIEAFEVVNILASVYDWGQALHDKYHIHRENINEIITVINNRLSTEKQIDAAINALHSYDITLNW